MSTIKRRLRSAAGPVALFLGRVGFSPNGLTITGATLTASVGLLAAQGWFPVAALCLGLFSIMDALDGALARATDRATSFGAFLDSVCDRYAEAAVFLGILWWYQTTGDRAGVMITSVALVGSLMVSYARARAEGLDYFAEVGWFQRTERLVVLTAGLLFAGLYPPALLGALLILAVLTSVTVLQRVLHVSRLAANRDLESSRGGRPADETAP